MAITATARAHVVRAVREALRVREWHARLIVDTVWNENALRLAEGVDLRGVRALLLGADGFSPHLDLHVDEGRGYERLGVELRVECTDLARWHALPMEEAHAVAADIHAARGPRLTTADAALQAEADALAAEIAADQALLAANDDDMDAAFGPVPEPRDWAWTDGTVMRADVATSGDHVVVLVQLDGGERRTMAMFPLFSGVAGLAEYAAGRIGVPARLCVGRVNAFDRQVPAGFDRSMPVLDMIVPRSAETTSLRAYRLAA